MVARKEAIINNVKQELAVANAQELMNVNTLGCHTRCVVLHLLPQKAGERCFAKCVTKPGDSLSNSEQVRPPVYLPSSDNAEFPTPQGMSL
jgi:import inner membrane translocase subunit TIM13